MGGDDLTVLRLATEKIPESFSGTKSLFERLAASTSGTVARWYLVPGE